MENKEVEDSTIYLTVSGSRSYGTNDEHSDTDIRGVCVPKNKQYYYGYGLKTFEQKEGGFDDDRVIYDLRKFIKLAVDNNPNILELLFTDERFWLKTSTTFFKLYENRHKFLSKNVKHRFLGYAWSQLNRIKRHRAYLLNPPQKKPERKDFELPEKRIISKDMVGAFEWLIANLLKNNIEELNFSNQTKCELQNVNWIGVVQSNINNIDLNCINITDEWMVIFNKEKAYNSANNEWNAYHNWKNIRNPKRKILEEKCGYDSKHAMQLVRLLRSGQEILETGDLKVYRDDREELLEIKRGNWKYEDLIEYCHKNEFKLNELYQTSRLQSSPDRNYFDNLCVELIENYIK